MKMKRVFSSLMALGLASTLVACGGGENKDNKAANNDADTKAEDKNKDDKDAKESEGTGEEGAENFEL